MKVLSSLLLQMILATFLLESPYFVSAEWRNETYPPPPAWGTKSTFHAYAYFSKYPGTWQSNQQYYDWDTQQMSQWTTIVAAPSTNPPVVGLHMRMNTFFNGPRYSMYTYDTEYPEGQCYRFTNFSMVRPDWFNRCGTLEGTLYYGHVNPFNGNHSYNNVLMTQCNKYFTYMSDLETGAPFQMWSKSGMEVGNLILEVDSFQNVTDFPDKSVFKEPEGINCTIIPVPPETSTELSDIHKAMIRMWWWKGGI